MKIYNVYVYNTYSTDANDEGIGVNYDFVGSLAETPSDLVLDALWEQEKAKIIINNEGASYTEEEGRSLSFNFDSGADFNDYKLIVREDETIEVEDDDDDDWVE